MQYCDDILIVGAGPTGLTLACALENAGIKSTIIDKRNATSTIPRAINISQPTLTILDKLGIDQEFLEEGLKLDKLTIYWEKKRIANINYKYIQTLYPYFYHLEQSRLEVHLERLLKKYGSKVERQVSLKKIEQHDDSVSVELKKINGQIETKHYSCVIGCDGGSSSVRTLADIKLNEERFPSYFILMDAELDHKFQQKKLRYYLGRAGYLIIVPLPKDKFRLIASFNENYPGNDNVNLSPCNFQKILDERGVGDVAIKKIIWTTSAGFFHRIAENARINRVFLAGDALHQFSPIGGTNMNTGIQDAFTLAQKLLLAKNQINKNIYLNSYEVERLNIAQKILNITNNATRLLTRNNAEITEYEKYLPFMRNRKHIKTDLPKLFSGIDL